jgi:hypothetical protein
VSLCGDGRLARPKRSRSSARSVRPQISLSSCIYRCLCDRIYSEIIPRFGGALGQATVGFSGTAQNFLLDDRACFWGGATVYRCDLDTVNFDGSKPLRDPLTGYALRNVSSVISGGTPIRTGKPNVPSPRFTYSAAFSKPWPPDAAPACPFVGIGSR